MSSTSHLKAYFNPFDSGTQHPKVPDGSLTRSFGMKRYHKYIIEVPTGPDYTTYWDQASAYNNPGGIGIIFHPSFAQSMIIFKYQTFKDTSANTGIFADILFAGNNDQPIKYDINQIEAGAPGHAVELKETLHHVTCGRVVSGGIRITNLDQSTRDIIEYKADSRYKASAYLMSRNDDNSFLYRYLDFRGQEIHDTYNYVYEWANGDGHAQVPLVNLRGQQFNAPCITETREWRYFEKIIDPYYPKADNLDANFNVGSWLSVKSLDYFIDGDFKTWYFNIPVASEGLSVLVECVVNYEFLCPINSIYYRFMTETPQLNVKLKEVKSKVDKMYGSTIVWTTDQSKEISAMIDKAYGSAEVLGSTNGVLGNTSTGVTNLASDMMNVLSGKGDKEEGDNIINKEEDVTEPVLSSHPGAYNVSRIPSDRSDIEPRRIFSDNGSRLRSRHRAGSGARSRKLRRELLRDPRFVSYLRKRKEREDDWRYY